MLCQNCHQRQASIHLYTKINGQNKEIDLCQQCYQELRNQQGNQMNNDNFFGDFDDLFNALNGRSNGANRDNDQNPSGPTPGRGGNSGGQSLLDQFGTDLTTLAKKGKIDPVIGRDREIARVIEILNRRTKNNPVLIGEAGVGKTAVVEGLARKTNNPRFAYDAYRRFVQMYGDVVLGMKPTSKDDIDPFEAIIEKVKEEKGVKLDNELDVDDLKKLVSLFKEAIEKQTGKAFPTDPKEQLWGAICAVFDSWMNERAILYRKMEGIPAEWGTAVNVQAMS